VTEPVEFEDSVPFSIEDEKFDLIYPARIRKLSPVFWTPVAVAAEAAKWLVPAPGVRVLDLGSGPGKFCLVAAALSEGHFTGVEMRSDLVTIARQAATDLKLSEIDFIHGNLLEIDFGGYDAFYLFNPFEENMFQGNRIDRAVPLSPELFRKYTRHVSTELGARPIGTRVATYMGYANDIPSCYSCEATQFGDDLKLWIKQREYDPDLESFKVSRSYHGATGWRPPRT
jgi:SAM-dependent methyltransferase